MGNRLRSCGIVLGMTGCLLVVVLFLGAMFTLAGLGAALIIQEIRFSTRAQSADAEVVEVGPIDQGVEVHGIMIRSRYALVRSDKLPHVAVVGGNEWWFMPEKGERVPILFEPDPKQIGPRMSWDQTNGVELDSFLERYLFPGLCVLVLGGGALLISVKLYRSDFFSYFRRELTDVLPARPPGAVVFVGVTALLALVPLGLLHLMMKIDTPERRAAWAIEDLRGDVEFSESDDTVKKVGFWDTGVTDAELNAALKQLKECKNLQTLDLRGTPVTDAALKELKEFKNLKELSLNNAQVTDGVLRTLGEIGLLHLLSQAHAEGEKRPSGPADVTSLSLGESKVTDEGLKELKELKNLQTLYLSGTAVTDEGLKELNELKNLQTLYLNGTKVTGKGLKDLKACENLQELHLSDTAVMDEGLKGLKELKNLQTLYLNGTKVTGSGLKDLKELKNLQTLYLINTKVTDEGLKDLKELKNLQTLNLWGTQVTDKGLKEFKACENLQELNLGGTAVTDEGLKELKDVPNLRGLGVTGTKVTDKGLKELKGCEHLQELNLGGTAVTDEGLKELRELKNLKKLWLVETKATNEGVKELKEALPGCDIVEKDPFDFLKDLHKDLERWSKDIKPTPQASTRPPVSRATIWTVVMVLLAALAVIAPAIYATTRVWRRAKRP